MPIIIYQILDNTTGNSYIGSTVKPIKTRLSIHLSCYNKWVNNNYITTYYSSFEILKNSNFIVYTLEYLPDANADTRYLRERHYVETIPNCVNKYIPSRTIKQYYNDNKTEITKLVREYYEKNKEKCIKQIKERYDNNTNGYRDKQIERNNYNAIQRLIERELDS